MLPACGRSPKKPNRRLGGSQGDGTHMCAMGRGFATPKVHNSCKFRVHRYCGAPPLCLHVGLPGRLMGPEGCIHGSPDGMEGKSGFNI